MDLIPLRNFTLNLLGLLLNLGNSQDLPRDVCISGSWDTSEDIYLEAPEGEGEVEAENLFLILVTKFRFCFFLFA